MAGYCHILPPASLRSSTPLVNEGGKKSTLNYNLKIKDFFYFTTSLLIESILTFDVIRAKIKVTMTIKRRENHGHRQ